MNEYIFKGKLCFKLCIRKHKAFYLLPSSQLHISDYLPLSYVLRFFTVQIISIVIEALAP